MTIDDIRLYPGIRVIETNAITKKIQRRTHHKKRINKKWLKRYGYRIIPDDEKVFLIGGCIYGTLKAIKKIEKLWRVNNGTERHDQSDAER